MSQPITKPSSNVLEDKRSVLICGGTAKERSALVGTYQREGGSLSPSIRIPICQDRSRLSGEIAALVAHVLRVPTSVCGDAPGLIDVVGEAIAASGAKSITFLGADEWLEADGQTAIERWIELTDGARFILTAKREPRSFSGDIIDAGERSLVDPELGASLDPNERDVLAALREGPALASLRTLSLAFPDIDVGVGLGGLLAHSGVEVDTRAGEVFIMLTEDSDRQMIDPRKGAVDRWDDALTLDANRCLDALGEPKTVNAVALLEAHRSALREAFERRSSLGDIARCIALLPGLLAAVAVRGPLDLVLHYTSIALELSDDPSLTLELRCKQAMLLRGLARNREVAPLLRSADDQSEGASPRAQGRLAATLAKVATPEIESADLETRALARLRSLPASDPICCIFAGNTRALLAWNFGLAEDALRHHIAVAAISAGRDLAQLDGLVNLGVGALGAGHGDVALRFIANLETEARSLGRTDLAFRAQGLAGCVNADLNHLELAITQFDAAIRGLNKGGFHHFERWHVAHRGFMYLLCGAHDRATRDFDMFLAMTRALGGSEWFGVLGGALSGSELAGDLLESVLAHAPPYLKPFVDILVTTPDPLPRAERTRALLQSNLPPPPGFYAFEMRVLGRAMSSTTRALPAAVVESAPVLHIGRNAEWFRVEGQPVVAIARMRNLRRVFEGLVTAHRQGKVMTVEAVFELGWPGERALPTSIGNRVHVTLSRLRALGLRDLLVFSVSGWKLDDRLRITFD